jgi:hypothetical protein
MVELNSRIDFLELSDNMGQRELGEVDHLKSPGASREDVRPSSALSGSPMLFLDPVTYQHSSFSPADVCISVLIKEGGGASHSFLWQLRARGRT